LEQITASNGIPLYVQLKDFVYEQIRTGSWKTGERIPTEEELKERFSISRATVRQALAELEREGLLVRQRGRGSFVAKPRIEMKLHDIYSFTLDLAARGLHPESRVMVFEVVMRNLQITQTLGLRETDPLVKLVRLRLADGDPIMLETTYIPEQLVPGLTREDVMAHRLYALLEERYGLRLERAVETLEPILIDDFAARMLEVSPGSPALFVERTGSLADGRKIELSQAIVRGDRCRYLVELQRQS